MGYHPEYLEVFLRAHHLLMHGDGPLAFNVRVYIAILPPAAIAVDTWFPFWSRSSWRAVEMSSGCTDCIICLVNCTTF